MRLFERSAGGYVEVINGTVRLIDLTAETGRKVQGLSNLITNSSWVNPIDGHLYCGLNVVADAFGDPALDDPTLVMGKSITAAGGIGAKTFQRMRRLGEDGATRWLGDLGATLPTSMQAAVTSYGDAHPHGGSR